MFLLSLTQLKGQTNLELFNTIARLDSAFFTSYNNCDLESYESFLSEDFEFYHDKQGMTKSRDAEIESMKVFCGEQRERQKLRRYLVTGSLQVFPMNKYGAIATGEHIFHLAIDEQTSKSVTKAKFTTLWKLEGDEWKMTRTFSFDHQPEPEHKLQRVELKLFEGNFQAADRVVNIRIEGDILKMTDIIDGQEVWSAELLPEGRNLFYLNFLNIQVEFIKTGSEVNKFVVYENGSPIEEAVRIK